MKRWTKILAIFISVIVIIVSLNHIAYRGVVLLLAMAFRNTQTAQLQLPAYGDYYCAELDAYLKIDGSSVYYYRNMHRYRLESRVSGTFMGVNELGEYDAITSPEHRVDFNRNKWHKDGDYFEIVLANGPHKEEKDQTYIFRKTDRKITSYFSQNHIGDTVQTEIIPYDLEELEHFFRNTQNPLVFTDVDKAFPVKNVRSGDYTVYATQQGGNFYVFWKNAEGLYEVNGRNEPVVDFAAYLPDGEKKLNYSALLPNVSTAEDMLAMDPYAQLIFYEDGCVCGYSYIGKDTALQVTFFPCEDFRTNGDLLIQEVTVVKRIHSEGAYRKLLSSDVPEKYLTRPE